MEYIDCSKLKLVKNDNQLITCTYDNKVYESVKVTRCFPLTNPLSYISLRYVIDDEYKEIGSIKDISELDDNNKKLILEDLELRYFIPEIIKIYKKSFKRQFYNFKCLTNAGEREIRVKDIIYNLFVTPKGDLLIKDCDENYYLIIDYKKSNDKNVKFIRSFL